MSEPMSPPPPPSTPPPPGPPPPMAVNPLQQVQGPAIGLVITGVLGILFALFRMLGSLFGFGLSAMRNLSDLGPGASYARYLVGGAGVIFGIIILATSIFVIWGALQMKQLRGWTLSVVASIVAMVPCLGPCCLVGIPIGIWALVVLMKPEVKAAFTS